LAAPEPSRRQRLRTRAGTLECEVSGKGAPTIVLFNGAGMTMDSWQPLRPAIDSLGTVFAWNRFGIEGSDAPRVAQTGAVVVASLRELMSYAGAAAPYVLVGHSLGALYASLFARIHSDQVAGALFIAPSWGPDADALHRNEEGFARSLAKVQGLQPDVFDDNLRVEIEAVEQLTRELEAAGEFPLVPTAQIGNEASGHFPQLKDPAMVLAELEALLDKCRPGTARMVDAEPGRGRSTT